LLWLFGYILGIIFFFIVPPSMIGWFVTPIAVIATLWVLLKKVKSDSISYSFSIAVIWTLLAVVLDYFLIVKAFNPPDGYYKFDVYLYYTLTFILPIIVYLRKKKRTQ